MSWELPWFYSFQSQLNECDWKFTVLNRGLQKLSERSLGRRNCTLISHSQAKPLWGHTLHKHSSVLNTQGLHWGNGWITAPTQVRLCVHRQSHCAPSPNLVYAIFQLRRDSTGGMGTIDFFTRFESSSVESIEKWRPTFKISSNQMAVKTLQVDFLWVIKH